MEFKKERVSGLNSIPTYEIKKVWHIGMMDFSLRKDDSLEGTGLSVSECPLAWEEIAELGGSYFELTKKNGVFLDFHALSTEQREKIIQWGIEKGFVTLNTLYKYIQYDEDGEEMYGLVHTYQEALEEAMEDEDCVVEVPNSIVPTPTFVEGVRGASLINTFDILTTVYNEVVLGLDGVWFHDELDRYALSAPRGVIALNKLEDWLIKEVEEREIPTWGSRYEE